MDKISDLAYQIDTSTFDHLFVLLLNKAAPKMVFLPVNSGPNLNDALDLLAKQSSTLVLDPTLYRAVVIGENGFTAAYGPETFRWLCGLGPNKTDPNWFG